MGRGCAPTDSTEFAALVINDWRRFTCTGSLFIDPGTAWQHIWIWVFTQVANQGIASSSFNGRPRYELLDSWRFGSLRDARIIIEDWLGDYNANRRPQIAYE